MNIGVVGNRGFCNYDILSKTLTGFIYLNKLKEITIVSGGCPKGADRLAERYAKEKGYSMIIYYPDWDKHGKRAVSFKNTKIVDSSDLVFVFTLNNSSSMGDIIEKCFKANKLCFVLGFTMSDGNLATYQYKKFSEVLQKHLKIYGEFGFSSYEILKSYADYQYFYYDKEANQDLLHISAD